MSSDENRHEKRQRTDEGRLKRTWERTSDDASVWLSELTPVILRALADKLRDEAALLAREIEKQICKVNKKDKDAPDVSCSICWNMLAKPNPQGRHCVLLGHCQHYICSDCAPTYIANSIPVDGQQTGSIEPFTCPVCRGPRFDGIWQNWEFTGSKLTDSLIASYHVDCMFCPTKVNMNTFEAHLVDQGAPGGCKSNVNLDNSQHVCEYCHEVHGPFHRCWMKRRVSRLSRMH
jgi:hypothetical protein